MSVVITGSKGSPVRFKIFGLFSVIMLLLCLAAVEMGVISYIWPGDAHYFWPQTSSEFATTGAETTSIVYSKGRFSFGGLYASDSAKLALIEKELLTPDPFAKGTHVWNHLGFSYRVGRQMGHAGWGIAFPFWAPVVVLLPLPLIWLRGVRRRRQRVHRRVHELCVNCGYDLCVSDQRCPECGAPYDPRRDETEWVAKVFGLKRAELHKTRRKA